MRGGNVFLVWTAFQRRSQSLANVLGLEVRYFHYKWEEHGRTTKALSYIVKFASTFAFLFRRRPRVVFVQLAPTPLLYIAAAYCAMTGARYVSDCHNTMIYDSAWIRWPFAKKLLRKSYILLVHNEDVREKARAIGLDPEVLRDPLPSLEVPASVDHVAGVALKEKKYVIVPCGMAPDEPIEELFAGAALVPDVTFLITGFSSKLPEHLRASAPENVRFTGFLDECDFNALYANAKAALVLTTREGTQPSGASEAIALGVPLVVSDIQTTRRIYGDGPIFVANEAYAIARGVAKAVSDNGDAAERSAALRDSIRKETERRLTGIEQRLMQAVQEAPSA